MRKAILVLLGTAVLGMITISVIGEPQQRAIKTEASIEPGKESIEIAQAAIRAELIVKDLLYQPGQAVEWQVGVLDDGTSRVGYANYICEVLGDHHVLTPRTQVRIVDIVKVSRGESFRTASLGHVACADRRVITP